MSKATEINSKRHPDKTEQFEGACSDLSLPKCVGCVLMLVSGLVGWSEFCMACWFVNWLVSWLVGWLDGWLVG